LQHGTESFAPGSPNAKSLEISRTAGGIAITSWRGGKFLALAANSHSTRLPGRKRKRWRSGRVAPSRQEDGGQEIAN
jgi:hypothetical protein